MTTTGHCLCGAVHVTIGALPEGFGICHCRMCQRWSGLAFAAVPVPDAALTVTGREHVRTYRSSDVSDRAFCGICGSTLWFRDIGGDRHELALGLLDDTTGLTLTHEIFMDRKSPAWAVAGDHRRETEHTYFKNSGHMPVPTASSPEGGQP